MGDISIAEIEKEIQWRAEAARNLQEEDTLLRLKATAILVRDALPQAHTVRLSVSDQPGWYRVPSGYYTADGIEITDGGSPTWDSDLEDALWNFCTGLDDLNAEFWEPFTRSVNDDDKRDGDRLLILEAVLAIEHTGSALQPQSAVADRATAGELSERLRRFPADHEVWVASPASPEGYQPLTGQACLGDDPDPLPGQPRQFVVLTPSDCRSKVHPRLTA